MGVLLGELNKQDKNGTCGLIRGRSQQLRDGSVNIGCEGP